MPRDSTCDEDEIIRAIVAETEAWIDGDIDAWSRCWLQDADARRVSARLGSGATKLCGFDEHRKNALSCMEWVKDRGITAEAIRRENWTIRVCGDMAWVTFDQITPTTTGSWSVPGLHYQIRVMEFRDGAWRIACFGEVQTRLGYYTCPWVRVERTGKVIEASPSATMLLKHHRALHLVGDRLCGRTRSQTVQLRDTLSREGNGDRVFRVCRVVPILFEEAGDGRFSICWVSNFDDMLVVLLDDDDLLSETLKRAGDVFGLSAAQLRVAERIAGGSDLTSASRDLGIRPTTARTHLNRMFEKVGVRTQAALMRTLLSLSDPSP